MCPVLLHFPVTYSATLAHPAEPSMCCYIVHNSGNSRLLMSLLTLLEQLLLILAVRSNI